MRRSGFIHSLAFVMLLAGASPALAGGYDTPILYSARHMGMGGTAIGYVYDPSAIFHNPAGLSHTKLASLIVNFSPLIGGIKSSPAYNGQNVESNVAFSPAFLLGGSYRPTDFMTIGLGVYPVAAAAASYEYNNEISNADGSFDRTEDLTSLKFIEVSPALSFDLPGNLSVAVGYRLTLVMLDRLKKGVGVDADAALLDLKLKGFNFAGFRAGIQWQPLSWLQLGLVYRHKTTTDVSSDSSTLFGQAWGETTMKFTLPSKVGFGVRADIENLGVAMDLEYNFNSQNDEAPILAKSATAGGADLPLANQFRWGDALTLRTGIEYSFKESFKARTGYIFDAKTANEQYPTAFGTPPAATHSITVGGGYTAGPWELNLAYAYRLGSATVTEETLAKAEYDCLPCSKAGDYELALHGVYVDFSYNW